MKYIITICVFICTRPVVAQVHCFAQIALDRNTVYVQQPFKVTITVLTATWYTTPLQFDNIQIPNAFTLPFNQTSPGMFDVQGQQYAGLQFYFIVFPYQSGHFTLPPIHIVATTPPKGSAVATKVNIHTPARSFTVKPVPEKLKSTKWLVAKNVFISEHWNKPLRHLKVGDVVERTITISARGTLPQFIPTLPPESSSFASTYLQDAELEDERNDYDANGRLTQSITYLLEKEGDFEVPPVEIDWWNPLNSRRYKKNTAAVRIHVASNPDLGMMTTLRDSLAATQANTTVKQERKIPYNIAGIPWYWFAVYSISTALIAYLLITAARKLQHGYATRQQRYRQSEAYYFRQLRRLAASPQGIIHHFYPWWDRLKQQQPAAAPTWHAEKQQALLEQWQQLNAQAYADANRDTPKQPVTDAGHFISELTDYRKNSPKTTQKITQKLINDHQLPWPPNIKT